MLLKYLFSVLCMILTANCYADNLPTISDYQRKGDFLGACKFAVKLARGNTNHDKYYYAARCKERYDSLNISDSEYIKWLEIAGNSGHHGALHILGELYENGSFVNASPINALKYYKESIAHTDNTSFIEKTSKKINFLESQVDCNLQSTKIFSLHLKCSQKNSLDNAIINAGGKLKERRDNLDIYESSQLLKGSLLLSVYYTNLNQFACLQYSFSNLAKAGQARNITSMIVNKYGKTDDNYVDFQSRKIMKWTLKDGLTINIESDIMETRLRYCHPAYEKVMLSERSKFRDANLQTSRIKQDNAY